MFDVIAKATWQTVYMVVGSTFFFGIYSGDCADGDSPGRAASQ